MDRIDSSSRESSKAATEKRWAESRDTRGQLKVSESEEMVSCLQREKRQQSIKSYQIEET